MNKLYDIFISHSSEDRKLGIALCHFLEERGLRCWIAPRDIQVGKDYGESIVDAIQASSIMIVVFSKSANESSHVRNEVERAFNHQLIIMPFRTQDIIPSRSFEYFLSSTHWLDALDGKAENYFDELHKNCALLTGKKTSEEAVPLAKNITRNDIKKGKNKWVYAVVLLLIAIGAAAAFFTISKPDKVLSSQSLSDTAKEQVNNDLKKDDTSKVAEDKIIPKEEPAKVQDNNNLPKENSSKVVQQKVTPQTTSKSTVTDDDDEPDPVELQSPINEGLNNAVFADLKSTNRLTFFIVNKAIARFQGKACSYEVFGRVKRKGNSFEVISGNVTGDFAIVNNRSQITGLLTIKSSELSCPINLKKQ